MGALPPSLIKMKQELAKGRSKKAAWAIIDEYFACFGPDAGQADLWTLLVACLTNSEVEEEPATRFRHDKIFYYEFTLVLLQAVNCLRLRRAGNTNPKRKRKHLLTGRHHSA